jgi:lysophospholipase L1-like esterase
MAKKYYHKHTLPVHSTSPHYLQYLFVGAVSAAFALALLFFNPLHMFGIPTAVSLAQGSLPEVQGVSDVQMSDVAPTPAPTIASAPTSSPTATPIKLKKKSYRIAVYGDSMVDTMGELLEYMDHELKRKYPETTFGLFNYGIGSQNVEEGLERFDKPFSYQTRTYPPITQVKADVIIIGSFAYNPFSPYDRDRHWLALTRLVQEAQKTGTKVYMLAEIAPLRNGFGKGPQGVNWSDGASHTHAQHIVEQLENAVGLAQALHAPLINAYEASKEKNGSGTKKYINTSDGIHPSVEGHELTAKTIIETLHLD